jgi:hypothetical protein
LLDCAGLLVSKPISIMPSSAAITLHVRGVVDEAVSLFLKAVLEVRKGRRLVTVDADTPGPVCEMATPTLSTLEWTANATALRLPSAAVVKMQGLTESSRKPGARLRSAARRLGK